MYIGLVSCSGVNTDCCYPQPDILWGWVGYERWREAERDFLTTLAAFARRKPPFIGWGLHRHDNKATVAVPCQCLGCGLENIDVSLCLCKSLLGAYGSPLHLKKKLPCYIRKQHKLWALFYMCFKANHTWSFIIYDSDSNKPVGQIEHSRHVSGDQSSNLEPNLHRQEVHKCIGVLGFFVQFSFQPTFLQYN